MWNGESDIHAPTAEKRRKAEKRIIEIVQQNVFHHAMSAIQVSHSLSKSNPLYSLNPILKEC